MEVLNAPILQKPQLLSRISPLRPSSSFPNHFRRNPLRSHRGFSNFLLKISFSSSSPLSNRRNLQISAHFGRPSKRRNSLRKKLSEEQQVRRNPDSFDPGSNFQNPIYIPDEIKHVESNLNCDNLKESTTSVEKSKSLGDSVLWTKLENWVDQCKKDAEFWGIGSGPVFTVFQDLDGNVESVSVHEDEILRRSQVELWSLKREERAEDFIEGNLKISHAKRLAREIKAGEYSLPRNSSIAKFVVSGKQSGFVSGLRSVTLPPDMFMKLSQIGFAMLCGWFVFWAMKRMLTVRNDGVEELTQEEKEMLRRKMKSRMEKEKMERGSVEVLPDVSESLMGSTERPQLDKQELMNSILKAKASGEKLTLSDSSNNPTARSKDFDDKIREIREMASRARELERLDPNLLHNDGDENEVVNEEISNDMEDAEMLGEVGVHFLNNLSDGDSGKTMSINGTINSPFKDDPQTVDNGSLLEASPRDAAENSDSRTPTWTLSVEDSRDGLEIGRDPKESESRSPLHLSDMKEEIQSCNTDASNKSSIEKKPRVIRSVKEAREYLSQKRDKGELDQEPKVRSLIAGANVLGPADDEESNGKASQIMRKEKKVLESSLFNESSNTKSVMKASESPILKKTGLDSDVLQSVPIKIDDSEDMEKKYEMSDLQSTRTSRDYTGSDCSAEAGAPIAKESWMEKNFQEFEPIIKKIGVGFRENYKVAKDKVQEELNLSVDITQSGSDEGDNELEWMKDDGLREIVFQVRENELMGRDPFHMMDAEDKRAFFEGLERKVEKENAKLLNLHELVHSRVENLDYGADGISLYDPPEKIIPRWKGPSVNKDPEFLRNFVQQRKAFFAENKGMSPPVNQDAKDTLQKSVESSGQDDITTSSPVYNIRKTSQNGASTNLKTVIESSDGSTRAGKKSGKEYWQHTKKWSREFLEAYNAETDPEVKSIMKDMGKDLDRWITEKQIQEAADLMTRVPKRKQKYMEKKLDKLKREMEMFGPQAVVSKYCEYAEEEEDYLWWLDLPFVLCIELYTNEGGDQKVGFYSLEMAADLELDPKQYHVIAFEDPGDSKSFCYIIQAHMEVLGNGHAFVVARPPKDAFRDAKANGFSVTVIRKGELQLNVDQTLEEVEEQITEIGSKMYHDKIMRERSVDMGSLMKGVFGASKSTKRRSKRMLKKPTKH